MKKEEAKEILSRPFNMKNVPQDILEAHRMAIEALKQESILDKIKQTREEIEHLSKYGKETYYRAIDDVLEILDRLIESEE